MTVYCTLVLVLFLLLLLLLLLLLFLLLLLRRCHGQYTVLGRVGAGSVSLEYLSVYLMMHAG